MEVIWYILLTVCNQQECLHQDVQWFDDKNKCEIARKQYEEIPADGNWDSVVYECKLRNAIEA